MRVRINRGSLGFLEEGRGMREAMHGWGGLMLDSAQLRSPLLAYLCTQGAGVFTEGSACSLEVPQGLAAPVQEVAKKCGRSQREMFLHPRFCRRDGLPICSSPQLPRFQKDRTQQMEQKLMLLSFCNAAPST